MSTRRRLLVISGISVILLASIVFFRPHKPVQHEPLTAPTPLATWPWPHASVSTPYPGVTYWTDSSSPDGTVLRLICFDFHKNPGLQFAIYDQDQDDAQPYDDNVDYWQTGVAQATLHLKTITNHPVIAAWNGLFFNCDPSRTQQHGIAHHVTPTVSPASGSGGASNGVVRYNVGNHRWAFGVKYSSDGRQTFRTEYVPARQTLQREFTFASGGAQCLIRNGRPLRLSPFPGPDAPPEPQPVPTAPDEAGHIPVVDHIKTSRVSMGWPADSHCLYLLFVKQPGSETGSITAFRQRGQDTPATARARILREGGWDIADEQRFWQAMGVWGAVNSDGGDLAQLTLLRPDGRYDLSPAQWGNSIRETSFGSKDSPATLPAGGSLMYFYIWDTKHRDR